MVWRRFPFVIDFCHWFNSPCGWRMNYINWDMSQVASRQMQGILSWCIPWVISTCVIKIELFHSWFTTADARDLKLYSLLVHLNLWMIRVEPCHSNHLWLAWSCVHLISVHASLIGEIDIKQSTRLSIPSEKLRISDRQYVCLWLWQMEYCWSTWLR